MKSPLTMMYAMKTHGTATPVTKTDPTMVAGTDRLNTTNTDVVGSITIADKTMF